MKPFSAPPNADVPANDDAAPTHHESTSAFWRVLAASGYGLWAWMGLALALGMYPLGRGSTLIPLAIGTVMASAGLLMAWLPWTSTTDWYGWRPRQDLRPTHAAMLALVTYLPMLAVGGLARGENDFWATRLAGAALLLCSVASLTCTGYRVRYRLSPAHLQQTTSSLPASRMIFAGYSGGLWLWLCLLTQNDPAFTTGLHPWILLLLVLALLLGLIEGLDWQALGATVNPPSSAQLDALRPTRFVAALFTYVLPCVALLLAQHEGIDLVAASLAVPSCLLGKWLERRMYEPLLSGSL